MYERDDLYDEAPGAAKATVQTAPPEKPKDKGQEDEEQTALLPKTFLGGDEAEVGDTFEVEVTAIHDEEISVRKLGKEESEEGEPEGPPKGAVPPGMAGAMGGMLE